MNDNATEITTDHDTDNTSPQEQIQAIGDKNNVKALNKHGKISYDFEQVDDFIDAVFHDLADDEYILGWAQNKKAPAFPKSVDDVLDRLERIKLAKVCYYGTASMTLNEDGNLYNRSSDFSRLHVVVLDDIGTKVPVDKLPADLKPSYIIESSEGNFQYGFILDTPVDNLELAKALIHLVYTSGFSDSGGKLPNKPVRLPCGINGADSDKGSFKVKLVELNDRHWSPDELLRVLDVGITWDKVVEDVNVVRQGDMAKIAGTSLWSPIKPVAETFDGVIDPVLEWLYENDMVNHDNGEWVTIECPWHHNHSEGGDKTAGYSPIGRGTTHANRRGFHCFHDSCSDKDTREFLKHIAQVSGINAPVVDNVADLVADYALVQDSNSVFRIRGVNKPVGMKMDAFRNSFPRKVPVFDSDGKEKFIPEHSLWLTAPARLTLAGSRYDPTSSAKIIDYDSQQYLNTYTPPNWGSGNYDENDVDTFKQFLDYLIPDYEQRDYFTQWLAAQVQYPEFRGAAIMMVAPVYGTGRTTLTDMVSTLLTPENCRKVTFPQLASAANANAYNDWLESSFVTCDEIMNEGTNKYKVYETLKELIDPRPKTMLLNTKYGAQRPVDIYTSFLLLTNHIDAIDIMDGDRRIYVISNSLTPESPEYFVALNRWLNVKDTDGRAKWARNVYRWLETVPVNLAFMNAPAPATDIKREAGEEMRNVVDAVTDAILDISNGVVALAKVEELAHAVFISKGVRDPEIKAETVKVLCRRLTKATSPNVRITHNGGKFRVRIRIADLAKHNIRASGTRMDNVVTALAKAHLLPVLQKLDTDFDSVVKTVSRLVDADEL